MTSLLSERYFNVSSLIRIYTRDNKYDKYKAFLKSLLVNTSTKLSDNHLELIYALANNLPKNSESQSLLFNKFTSLLYNINDVTIVSRNDVEHHFLLAYHLVSAIIQLSASEEADNEVECVLTFPFSALIDQLNTCSQVGNDKKKIPLSNFFIMFGYLLAITENSSLVFRIIEPSNIELYTKLSKTIDNDAFNKTLLESINSENSKQIWRFNQTFNPASASFSGNFSLLLFKKYLGLLRLNIILSMTKIQFKLEKTSLIEYLVYLRSLEYSGLTSNITDDDESDDDNENYLKVPKYNETTSIHGSIITSKSYIDVNALDALQQEVLKEISAQSLQQIIINSQYENNIIADGEGDSSLLLFQLKTINLEIFSCLYFVSYVDLDFIVEHLLSRNLIFNDSQKQQFSSSAQSKESLILPDDSNSIASSTLFHHYNRSSLSPLSEANSVCESGFAENLELNDQNLCGNIFGFLSLLSLDSNNTLISMTGLINRRITSVVSRNPELSFRILRKALRCIAIAYRCLSQDVMIGLIYNLINILAVDDFDHGKVDLANTKKLFNSSIQAIIELTNHYMQDDITELVLTVFIQKFSNGPLVLKKDLNGLSDPSETTSESSSNPAKIGAFVSGYSSVSRILSSLLVKNLYKLLCNLTEDSKNFQLLLKTYSTLLSRALSINDWDIAREIMDAYCKIATVLKNNFYLISSDDFENGDDIDHEKLNSRINVTSISSFLSLPKKLPAEFETSKVASFYDSNKNLMYDLTNYNVFQNYKVFLNELLNGVISKGNSLNKADQDNNHRSHAEITEVAKQIEIYLRPLALLLPSPIERQNPLLFKNLHTNEVDIVSVNLFRNFWFNLVIHGVNIPLYPFILPQFVNSFELPDKSKRTYISDEHAAHLIEYLAIIAYNSPPLASKLSWSHNENLLELNTVLRRSSSHSNSRFQKSVLDAIISSASNKIPPDSKEVTSFESGTVVGFKGKKITSTPKLMFLASTIFAEFLRIKSGNFFSVLYYFSDPSIKLSKLEKDMKLITFELLTTYLASINSKGKSNFAVSQLSYQLNEMLTLTCATNSYLQSIAIKCCDTLIAAFPSSLTNQNTFTLFKLLDLLNLLFISIVNYEKQRYNPVLEYSLPNYALNLMTKNHDISSFEKITLLDSLEWRKETFTKLQKTAKEWILYAIEESGEVTKNLLQSYVVISSNICNNAEISMKNSPFSKMMDNNVNFGVSFAVEMGKTILPSDKEIFQMSSQFGMEGKPLDSLLSLLIKCNLGAHLSNTTPMDLSTAGKNLDYLAQILQSKVKMLYERFSITKKGDIISIIDDITHFLSLLRSRKASIYDKDKLIAYELEFIEYFVQIPFKSFDPDILEYTISNWLIISASNPKLHYNIMTTVLSKFRISIINSQGLFNNCDSTSTELLPEYQAMKYAPSDKTETNHFAYIISRSFKFHLLLIRLINSYFKGSLYISTPLLKIFNSFILFVLHNFSRINHHPFSRIPRFEIIKLAIDIFEVNLKLNNLTIDLNFFNSFGNQSQTKFESFIFISLILDAALDWFKYRKTTPFGDNLLKIKTDLMTLESVNAQIKSLNLNRIPDLTVKQTLLLMFLHDEIKSIQAWLSPLSYGLNDITLPSIGETHKLISPLNESFLREVYDNNSELATSLISRLTKLHSIDSNFKLILKKIVFEKPLLALQCSAILDIVLDTELYLSDSSVLFSDSVKSPLRYLVFWKPISPIDSINLFLPKYVKNPYILQYAMKSLMSHDVHVTFFYVPQIVQMLRYDVEGYVERFILETAQVSQMFTHQIIWNMLANSYKGDEGVIEDSLKPTLDKIRNLMIDSFSTEDHKYYEKEFSFFKEITDISAKLKPYIKKTKAEKKIKIDEEMKKIKVEPGVYLPSNPDGIVVDVNRTSGKPLQSHARAPFMASFKISKDVEIFDDEEENLQTKVNTKIVHKEVWQGAIFKVGDDCRQDVLALQIISVFRSIWANTNLDLYVYPYRVTATDAGCGIIDVLPNSVSRDMLGREAVNGLYEYYTTKFGPEYSTGFQRARNNLIKSLAGYSIISYLLQFKDRHNGNIMYDSQGHILHVDFGFCFDIVPGGVKFEAVPFKLTKEMIMVMGGSSSTQSFKRFEELCVQGYLAARPYMDTIVKCVVPMLDSGLPCFKGMTTIKNLKNRFVPNKSEKEAELHMRKLIRKSYESFFTKGYDEFQRITNGIPY